MTTDPWRTINGPQKPAMTELERLIALVSDPIACGRDDHDLELDNHAFWEASVRALLTALREPSSDVTSAGGEITVEPWQGVTEQEIGDLAASRVFTTMIDHILNEEPEGR